MLQLKRVAVAVAVAVVLLLLLLLLLLLVQAPLRCDVCLCVLGGWGGGRSAESVSHHRFRQKRSKVQLEWMAGKQRAGYDTKAPHPKP